MSGKCQCCSSQLKCAWSEGPRQDEEEAANDDKAPEECPVRKCKERKALKEPRKEAFSKECGIIKVARQVYQKAHWANFEQEGSYNLSSVFHQMATSTNLLNAEVYEVQETWGGQKDLRTANWVARASPKDIHFFQII